MKDFQTIIGVLELRAKGESFATIQRRFGIGNSTIDKLLDRRIEIGLSVDELREKSPKEVEELFYPSERSRRKDTTLPDFQECYERIHAAKSRVNLTFLWIEYKDKHPDGYEFTQFRRYYHRFVEENYGKERAIMAVGRVPGEKMYIDWVGDQPALLVDTTTGELKKVHVFTTTLGVSNLVYAEIFPDEKLHHFLQGVAHAITFYGAIPKYLVPDNLKTAITSHNKDNLDVNAAFQDLERFYNCIILPPPPRKPKGKSTVEKHVQYLETHLVEKLKEEVFTSFEQLNARVKEIVNIINNRPTKTVTKETRLEMFDRYDKPCMKSLTDGEFMTCEYKAFSKVPDNYHLEFDGHYYSVSYKHLGEPAIIKATPSEVIICDKYNRVIYKHQRSYKNWPKYITCDEHMKPEHLYYKNVNSKDGDYYRRWAAIFGPNMAKFIDIMLQSQAHEEQAYNSCNGLLHACKNSPHYIVEEVAQKCLETKSVFYSTFKKRLEAATKSIAVEESSSESEFLPSHANIRGEAVYAEKIGGMK